jgi:hypothetical protein
MGSFIALSRALCAIALEPVVNVSIGEMMRNAMLDWMMGPRQTLLACLCWLLHAISHALMERAVATLGQRVSDMRQGWMT